MLFFFWEKWEWVEGGRNRKDLKIIRTICLLNGTNVARKEKEEKGKKGKEILRIEKFFLYEREMPSTEVRFILKCDTEKVKKRNCIINSRFYVGLCAGYPIYVYTQRDITKLIVIK